MNRLETKTEETISSEKALTSGQKAVKAFLIAVTLFAITTLGLYLGHVKPFDQVPSIFQYKYISVLIASGLILTGLFFALAKQEEESQKTGFFNLTLGQKVFLAAFLIANIAIIILGQKGLLHDDLYTKFINSCPASATVVTLGVFLGLCGLLCSYNMKEENDNALPFDEPKKPANEKQPPSREAAQRRDVRSSIAIHGEDGAPVLVNIVAEEQVKHDIVIQSQSPAVTTATDFGKHDSDAKPEKLNADGLPGSIKIHTDTLPTEVNFHL